jgi:hypothetical protein
MYFLFKNYTPQYFRDETEIIRQNSSVYFCFILDDFLKKLFKKYYLLNKSGCFSSKSVAS